MKAFAAAGIIAAASAVSTEATPTPSFNAASLFDSSKYYSYGYYDYTYPEFDHKEELTPERVHPKKSSGYKTNNIDIFAHSSSDEEEHHHGYGHHTSPDSESDTSEDERKPAKKHMIFLTGDGPEGDHCHEGDYCGKVDTSSDYTDSDYETPVEESSEEHFVKPAPGCGGRRCARVDFDWNYYGIDGTLDIYQPYGSNPELLFDGDWDGLKYGLKYNIAIKSLPKYDTRALELDPANNDYDAILRPDYCGLTGSTLAFVGQTKGDKYGGGKLRSFSDELCLEDFIGNSVDIRLAYYAYNESPMTTVANDNIDGNDLLACGNVVEVECPPLERRYPDW